jgi:hypothetical protein
MVILTLLAWATQTLFHQWGYGGVILPGRLSDSAPFEVTTTIPVPEPTNIQPLEIMLELRPQIKAQGSKLTLRDVCRWPDQDAAALEPVADMVVARVGDSPGAGGAAAAVSVDQIKSALHDAGVNLSAVRFSGAATCAVIVGDASPSNDTNQVIIDASQAPQTSLKDLLLADVHERLKLGAQQVQVDFDPKDAKLLAITSPNCRIDFDAGQSGQTLGPVVWSVVIQDGTTERMATIAAAARMGEEQLVLTRPLSRGQAIL